MSRPHFTPDEHRDFALRICAPSIRAAMHEARIEYDRIGIQNFPGSKHLVDIERILRPYPLTEAVEWIRKHLEPKDIWPELADDDSHVAQVSG